MKKNSCKLTNKSFLLKHFTKIERENMFEEKNFEDSFLFLIVLRNDEASDSFAACSEKLIMSVSLLSLLCERSDSSVSTKLTVELSEALLMIHFSWESVFKDQLKESSLNTLSRITDEDSDLDNTELILSCFVLFLRVSRKHEHMKQVMKWSKNL